MDKPEVISASQELSQVTSPDCTKLLESSWSICRQGDGVTGGDFTESNLPWTSHERASDLPPDAQFDGTSRGF